jgi:hypothetical protein
MAVHYCLQCDGKFKKYNQAITHYDAVRSLAAPFACDQCEQTLRDMYSCVKHKHEFHGQFDANFQFYICKEVFYSCFRLGTHMKECHKQFYGEFVLSVVCDEALGAVLPDEAPEGDSHWLGEQLQHLPENLLWPPLPDDAHKSEPRERDGIRIEAGGGGGRGWPAPTATVCSPPLKMGGHVGFDSLPDQDNKNNKSVQNVFTFNILIISGTGVGNSTLADSLFNTSFDSAA